MAETEVAFKLDRDKMQDLFVEVFLKSISKEDAQSMLHDAMTQVLQSDYNVKRMLEKLAHQVIAERLSDKANPFTARLVALIDAAIERVLQKGSDDNEQVVTNIANAIAKSLSGSRFV
jgi:flagellar biosynthesis/type III secretory pathway protein FliH